MSSLTGPPPITRNPLRLIASDARREVAAARAEGLPPGDTDFSLRRTNGFRVDPLPLLLDAYERHGPVFSMRILHSLTVFALGPEANHTILVANAKNFSWREGFMRDLWPFLGDGLLTIDGDFHRSSRRIMLPAFHRERIVKAHTIMEEETERALATWADGAAIDLNEWTRRLALRIAMRALFGWDVDGRTVRDAGFDVGHAFETALGFHGRDFFLQVLRGPRTPFAQMQAARAQLDGLIYGQIQERRRTGERGDDILSLLLDAEDEHGETLSDQHVRDEVITLLFAGHDTTTSTVDFMFYELAMNAHEEERLVADLDAGSDERLDLVLDETLRKYPAAWIGPRRAIETCEIAGVRIPGGLPVAYSSWASHNLPDVWPDPQRFDPDRFAPGRREEIPKGAYVPFGGGSRMCVGMRFGEAEIRVIARRVLADWHLELDAGYRLSISQTPTIGPRGALPFRVHRRRPAPAASGSGVARPAAPVPVA
jgi:cytochrome P450